MRSYKEILRFLIIREQLLQGWKIGFVIVCAALLYLSLTLSHVKIQTVEISGTVVSHGADPTDEGHNAYLIIKLDNGETVRARPVGPLDYRPGKRGIVRQITTNFFGLKKHEFKGYLDEPPGE